MDDVSLVSLWLPILLSSVAVFVASFLAWVVSPHHKPDWKGIPNEDGFLEALRANNTPPGQYMFPYCADYSELKDPEKKKRYAAGPHGTLTVWPGMPNQTPKMVASFIFFVRPPGWVVVRLATLLAPGSSANCSGVRRPSSSLA